MHNKYQQTKDSEAFFDIGMMDNATMIKHGICRSIQGDGSLWEGMYVNNKLNGFGRHIDHQSRQCYTGMWKDDKYDGFGKCVSSNGSYYEGYWRNGLREGQGGQVTAGGVNTSGFWKDDKF